MAYDFDQNISLKIKNCTNNYYERANRENSCAQKFVRLIETAKIFAFYTVLDTLRTFITSLYVIGRKSAGRLTSLLQRSF